MPKKLIWEGVTWTRESKNVHDKPIKCSGCGDPAIKTETFTSRRHGTAKWCPDCVSIVESEQK